ncbi:D-cysteine desulfhydrase [Ranunculus cassubicifolius]
MAGDEGSMQSFGFLSQKPYNPPSWAKHLAPIPSEIYSLAQLPTPIHKWNLPNLPNNVELWIKRDDLAGMQLSGNKVRKLEFLMADAIKQGADCVITIGGIQSNHCRTTAVAAKYLNLDCYLILGTSKILVDKDPGLTGNLLVERLVGAHVDLITIEEYYETGGEVWGYIEAIRELEEQLRRAPNNMVFQDIVVACGSGGTIAGLSLGSWLSSLKAKIHAFSVSEDPDYFYDYVQGLLDGLHAGVSSRDIVDVRDSKGLGYALSTREELEFVKEVAAATGVILDPVYSGKAAFGMLKDMNDNPAKWEGRKVLFIHTGGLLGLYDKTEQIAPMMGNWRRMDIPQ